MNFLKDAAKIIFPYLNVLQSESEKSFWIKKIAEYGDAREESLWQDFSKFKKTARAEEAPGNLPPVKQNSALRRKDFLEKRIIGIISLLNSREFLSAELINFLTAGAYFFSEERKRAFNYLLKKEGELFEREAFELEALALETEFIYNCEVVEFEAELQNLLKDLKKEAVKEKMDTLGLEIKNIEMAGRSGGGEEILLQKIAEFNRLSRELNELNPHT